MANLHFRRYTAQMFKKSYREITDIYINASLPSEYNTPEMKRMKMNVCRFVLRKKFNIDLNSLPI